MVKLQKDAAIYSSCVCQNLVGSATADYTDKFACTILKTVPCSAKHDSSTCQHIALLKHMHTSGTRCDSNFCHALLYTKPSLPMSLDSHDCKQAHMAYADQWAMAAGRPYQHRGSDQCSATCEEGVRLGLRVLLACLACLLEWGQPKCCRSAGLWQPNHLPNTHARYLCFKNASTSRPSRSRSVASMLFGALQ